MQDPLIGLTFDPDKVRFEAAPAVALTAEDRRRGKWYLFAKYEDGSHKDRVYLLISGLVSIYGDSNPRKEIGVEPDFGFVSRCDGGKCSVLGVADRLFDDLEIPESAVSGLAADAVSRALSAFGGRKELQASLDEVSAKAKNLSMEAELLRSFESAGLDMTKWRSR